MKILITNDDGIRSPILPVLAQWAAGLGEVTLIAPKHQQSAKSQSIDFTRPIEVLEVPLCKGIRAYSVDSTPADCVRFGISGLKERYDLVISGVNCGYNLGADIPYSATVGAILEASRYGVKGLALSTDFDILMESADYFDTIWKYIEERHLLDLAPLYNVNIPHREPKGILITKQGGIFYTDEFVHKEGVFYEQIGGPYKREYDDLSLDIDATMNGYISITPITASKTDLAAYSALRDK